MRLVMLMFDTLTRNYLPNYGNKQIIAPNFERLSTLTTTFDECYGGSMPCMPARRELHTGKYNFLNRSWGPLEPFDNSMIANLKERGIYTHLVTDHSHYFEDGGATYHNRYNTYEAFRGQEGDRWVPQHEADTSLNTCHLNKKNESSLQHYANRTRIINEEDMPSVKTVNAGIDFIEHYHDIDNWMLQIECFDPHEPFFVPDKYRKLYQCTDSKNAFNFPAYTFNDGKYSEEDIANLRKEYMALLTMCDAQLAKVLNVFDKYDMWKDTMLIVNTDHGFFLGEKDYIGKNFPPMYDEVIHTPLFIHDPRSNNDGQRRSAVCQTVDLVPTIMNYFGLETFEDIDGKNLDAVIKDDSKIHDEILFGIHGGHVNIYDGHYCYMRSTVNKDVLCYNDTLMPVNMRSFFNTNELNEAEFVDGGRYANGNKVLRVPMHNNIYNQIHSQHLLFDKLTDPYQQNNIHDKNIEKIMIDKLVKKLDEVDSPLWQYERLGLKKGHI